MVLSAAIILAAGAGTRMKTPKPKVLHSICGKPLIEHLLEKVNKLTSHIIIVVGHQGEEVKNYLGSGYTYVYQQERKGTGHAVMEAVPYLPENGTVMVLCGDTPLLNQASLQDLAEVAVDGEAGLLTAEVLSPTGYGRIVRKGNHGVDRIVEEVEASEAEKEICEINTGTYCFKASILKKFLPQLSPSPKTGEYYLTDIISFLTKQNYRVIPYMLENYQESLGVNTLQELYQAEHIMREKINHEFMLSGVRMLDPHTTYLDVEVKIGSGTVLYPQTIIEGNSTIGDNCCIGPFCHLKDVTLDNRVTIENSVAEKVIIGENSVVGPFAYLRPGTNLGAGVKIGDFVEIKNSEIDERTKVPHLSYLGDAKVGADVNFGAGSIIVNYDGKKKHQTVVEEGAFIGCNSNLIAPIHIGKEAYIAAGSTLSNDVPGEALAIARSPQINKSGLAKRLKGKKSPNSP